MALPLIFCSLIIGRLASRFSMCQAALSERTLASSSANRRPSSSWSPATIPTPRSRSAPMLLASTTWLTCCWRSARVMARLISERFDT
jgi:hypothetical protein